MLNFSASFQWGILMKKILIIMLLCFCPSTFSESDLTETIASTIPTLYCPPIETLVKDTLTNTWYVGQKGREASSEYKSDAQSFVSQIDHFVGVQWAGIEIGQIACVYAGVEADTFPVILYYNKLVMQPKGGLWGKDLGGHMNCKSSSRNDCPYQPRVRAPAKDIYEDALNIK